LEQPSDDVISNCDQCFLWALIVAIERVKSTPTGAIYHSFALVITILLWRRGRVFADSLKAMPQEL
jgi:hypothetical protein